VGTLTVFGALLSHERDPLIGARCFLSLPSSQIDASGGFLTHGWGDSLVLALAVKTFSPPKRVAQFLGLAYEHGSHGQLLPVSAGDWMLRFYAPSHERRSRGSGPRGGSAALLRTAGAAATAVQRGAARLAARARAAVGLAGAPPLPFPDPSRPLSPYFCGLHVVLLDLALGPRRPGALGARVDAGRGFGAAAVPGQLPVATIPPWVCAAASTPVAGRHAQERAVTLGSSCMPPRKATGVLAVPGAGAARTVAAARREAINLCWNAPRGTWLECMQRSEI